MARHIFLVSLFLFIQGLKPSPREFVYIYWTEIHCMATQDQTRLGGREALRNRLSALQPLL